MPIITAKGLVTIPREIRDHLGVGPGSKIDFLVVGDHVVIRPATCLSADALGKHHFGRWASGHADTSIDRKSLIRASSPSKGRRRPRR